MQVGSSKSVLFEYSVANSLAVAQYLHFADQVVALPKDGRILQNLHGDDTKPVGLLKLLENPSFPDEQIEKEIRNIDIVLEDVAISNEAKDLARKSGDMNVYKYYLRSVGFVNMSVFVCFCVLNVFCGSFSGRLTCDVTLD